MSRVGKLLEDWEVYSPSEEASEPNVGRSKFDSVGIRNIMMSYFMHKDFRDTLDAVRYYIDKMPDEWIVEFLRNQDDTVVNKIQEALKETKTNMCEESDFSAWNALYHCRFNAAKCFGFFFATSKRDVTSISFDIKATKTDEIDNTEAYLVVYNGINKSFALFNNGVKIYDHSNTNPIPENIQDCISQEYLIYKLSQKPRKLSAKDRQAIKIGLQDVLEPYGSFSSACQKFLKTKGIDQLKQYVPQKNIFCASKPSLYYSVPNQQFECVIGQHGKGFYNIPVDSFFDYCKEDTDENEARRVFVAAQD